MLNISQGGVKEKDQICSMCRAPLLFKKKKESLFGEPKNMDLFPVRWQKYSINSNGNPNWSCNWSGDVQIVDDLLFESAIFCSFGNQGEESVRARSCNMVHSALILKMTNGYFSPIFLTYVKHIFHSAESWRKAYVGSSFLCQFSLSFRNTPWLWYSGLLHKGIFHVLIHIHSSPVQ